MSDADALVVTRAFIVAASLVVVARSLVCGRGPRVVSTSPRQRVWITYVVAFAAMWWHPVVLAVPAWCLVCAA